MSLLSKKVVKTVVVVNDEVRETINKDLAEGNFEVMCEEYSCCEEAYPFAPKGATSVTLMLYSGYTITIEK